MKHEKRFEISVVLQIQTRAPFVATLEREAVSGPRAGRLVDLPRAHPPTSVLRPLSSNSHVQEGAREERERERQRRESEKERED